MQRNIAGSFLINQKRQSLMVKRRFIMINRLGNSQVTKEVCGKNKSEKIGDGLAELWLTVNNFESILLS